MVRIFLTGYMGAGKTTLGKAFARKLNVPFIDLDWYIEERFHKTVGELFTERGEAGFRELERNMLHEVAEFENVVISTGGGAPCFYDNMEFMNRTGKTVFLNVHPDVLFRRLRDLDKISRKEVNFKSKLIEWSQKNKMEVSFELIEQFLDHDSNPVFQTEVRIEGLPAGTGTGYSKKESQQNAAQMAIKKVKEPTFMSTIEEIKIQHSATETETEMEVELATGSDTELATELENELETELNANPEIKPENVSEENILVDEISTVQDTEAPATNQNKSPCDDPESPNRDLQ